MNTSLNKSLRQFNDAVSKSNRSILRSSKYIPKTHDQSLTRIPPAQISSEDESADVMGQSIRFSDTFTQDCTLRTTQKTTEFFDKLYTDFFEITQMHKSRPEIFQTIADYIQSCTDNFNLIVDTQSKTMGKSREAAAKEAVWLEKERNVWRLIYALYWDRFMVDKDPEIPEVPLHILSEKQCIENLYKKEQLVREYQLIVDWLERNAADQRWTKPRLPHFTDNTIAWENTFLQLTSDNIMFPSTRPIVSNLDPDAPFRENRALHDMDIEDDRILCKLIYTEIRCGKLQEAEKLAEHCGQHWRAIMMEGWKLYHDNNFENDNPTNKQIIEGNPNRALWKRITYLISNRQELDQYWRASLGVLSGNLSAVLPVCVSWEDMLWAHLKTMIDIRVESELRDTLMGNYASLPDQYWQTRYSMNDILNKISDHGKHYLIECGIIMDNPIDLIRQIRYSLTESEHSTQVLRMFAHIVLVFKELGITGDEEDANYILECYVQSLIESKRNDLIAFYTSTLPQSKQIEIFAKFLEGITDYESRKSFICSAEQVGLDIEAITKRIVENIRNIDSIISTPSLADQITPIDLKKISSIEWLLFYETQQLEAVFQTNALIRFFIVNNKLEGARLAYNKIPVETCNSIVSPYATIPNHIQNVIKEFLCHKAYLDALESFNDWFHHFHHDKPKEPSTLLKTATFAERVAHEHRMSQYQADLQRWKLTMEHKTRNTLTVLYNVLLFPDGGWLVDTNDEETDSRRIKQLEELRSICIPKVVLLLHLILHETGQLKQCIQLADLVADSAKDLFKVFDKQAIKELVDKITNSCMELIEQKKDPWGYEEVTL